MGLENFEIPTDEEKRILIGLVYRSTLSYEEKAEMIFEIGGIMNYRQYQDMSFKLEALQPTIREMPYYSETDIAKHIKRFIH